MSNGILTTHTGSLPRPAELTRAMYRHQDGEDVPELGDLITDAVDHVVERQVAAGVDIVSDGEMGKPGFLNYIADRLSGFGGQADPWSFTDLDAVPELAASQYAEEAAQHIHPPRCIGEITYVGRAELERDISNLKDAVARHGARSAFMPAASPGVITQHFPNDHYGSYQDYLFACADALSEEYRLIVDAGLTLQLDCPDIPTSWPGQGRYSVTPIVEEMGYHEFLELHVEALNRAVAGLAPESMRMHLCWGNNAGPHHFDLPLRDLIDPVLKARPGAISFEAANPRHEHEWEVFESVEVPGDKVLVPGVIDTLTSFVEHPRVVAQRLQRFVEIFGPERVIGGTDCGFGTFVGFGQVGADVTWLKLASLAEGARAASAQAMNRSA